jgi:hypothetical protein
MPSIATTLRAAGLVVIASAFAVSLPACKKPDQGRSAKRTVQAKIADFDPNEEVVLDLDKYGTARVDDYLVSEAFNRSFDGLDKCVQQTKTKEKLGEEAALEGDADFTVKLNPNSERPFAVNAKLSAKKWDQNKELKDCLREAVANAGYPMYDGPPQVAVFSTQLDPGTVEADDNDW